MKPIGLVLALLVAVPSLGQAQSVRTTEGILKVSAFLKGTSLDIRPVGLTRFALVSSTGDTISIGTGRTGEATAQVAPGQYQLVSIDTVRFEDGEYRWDLPIVVSLDTVEVELSNLNAIRGSRSVARVDRSSRMAPEAAVFQRARSAVVRVDAGLSHGSGFIVDSLGGVIITNAHVIGNVADGDITIALDSVTRASAQILARDNSADVAILRIADRFLESRARLGLSIEPLEPGERVLALGFPLSQNLTMTSGIVSSVRDGAVISDVNINPGNSGGPMLNLNGEVVALNTFGESASYGPGVSGSVLVSRVARAMSNARGSLGTLAEPSSESLPTMPREVMSASGLRAAAASVDYKDYRRYSRLSVNGRFTLSIQTPLATFAEMAEYERQVAKDRRQREARAGLTTDERFSEIKEYRDWVAYVGNLTAPVVSIVVQPDVGETGGSVFARAITGALTGVQTQAKMKFKGDVRGVRVFRGDSAVPMVSLRGGHAPVSVWEENRWVELKDVADLGYYVFDPELFRPSADGMPPVVIIAVEDLKNPGRWSCVELPRQAVARAWNDFEDYYREYRSDRLFNPAQHRLRPDATAARQVLKEQCNF